VQVNTKTFLASVFNIVLAAAGLQCLPSYMPAAAALKKHKAAADIGSACPAGSEDMMNWFTMSADLRQDNHLEGTGNPMYTEVRPPADDGVGEFIWTKSKKGYPWDVKLYDSEKIYIWYTESSWTDAHTFKAFSSRRTMALSPRCVNLADPDPKSTFQISDTSFEVHSSCKDYVTKNLKKAITHLSGPENMNFGGDLPQNLPTMIASYQYICDNNYRNCRDKEEFYLAKPYGIVQWQHYKLDGDDYRLVKTITFNRLVKGQVTPELPCLK
jgi:hypothetical protein